MIPEVPKKWVDDNAVYFLLDKWKSHEQDFKQGQLRHEVIWRLISFEMEEGGYDYSGAQCENKFRDLRKKYMKIKDHNNQTGAEPKIWKYFDNMEVLFGEKPNVKPVSLASNRRKRVLNSYSDSEGDFSADESKPDESIENSGKKKKGKLSKVEKQMQSWADIMNEQSKAKREDQNRRHKENQELMNKMLEANNTFFSKLLDKL